MLLEQVVRGQVGRPISLVVLAEMATMPVAEVVVEAVAVLVMDILAVQALPVLLPLKDMAAALSWVVPMAATEALIAVVGVMLIVRLVVLAVVLQPIQQLMGDLENQVKFP
jgi:hypothetical protein